MKEDLTGKKFGRLTAEKYLGVIDIGSDRRSAYSCSCECGNSHTVSEKHLKAGKVQSCGCIRASTITKEEEIKRVSISNKNRRDHRKIIISKLGYNGKRPMQDFFRDLSIISDTESGTAALIETIEIWTDARLKNE